MKRQYPLLIRRVLNRVWIKISRKAVPLLFLVLVLLPLPPLPLGSGGKKNKIKQLREQVSCGKDLVGHGETFFLTVSMVYRSIIPVCEIKETAEPLQRSAATKI